MPRAALPRLSRRSVLVGAGAAGGLVAAAVLIGPGARPALPLRPGQHLVDAMIRLDRDGSLSVGIPATEMGQGIATLCAQVVAVELGADWARIGVEPLPLSPRYADAVLAADWAPLWFPGGDLPWIGADLAQALAGAPGDRMARRGAAQTTTMITAQGTTIAAFEQRLRLAAAALRAALIGAAAAQAGVDPAACDTRDHQVVCGHRAWPFAGLIAAALAGRDELPVASGTVLRPTPAQETGDALGPCAFPRLDLPAKVDGSLVFAADVRLPDMVHAAIAHGPQGDCHLASHDPAAAHGVPGVIATIATARWLAVVAQTWHAADRALTLMEPRFRLDPDPGARVVDSGAVDATLDAALAHGAARRLAATGDPDPLLASGALTARYDVAPALHAPPEPASATARLAHGRLELWIATQAPEAAAQAAAHGAGIARQAVTVYPLPAGGSFDARLDTRIAGEVATLAARTGRPVQLTWSRWQETLAGYPRTPVAATMAAAFDPARRVLLGWRARLALPPTAFEWGERLFHGADAPAAQAAAGTRADALACAGAMPLYALPDCAVDHVPVAISLPTARLRGGAHGYTAFLTECFIDECAHAAQAEPLAFRMGLLGGQPRLAACLQGAASLAMWGGGGAGAGQGLACHAMTLAGPEGPRTGMIAVVASVRVEAGAIRVQSLHAFADIGRVINRDIARQQIEGGLLFGLAHALGGSTTWHQGRPGAGRLEQLGLPLLADCPKVAVAFARSSAEPFDPGELGMVAAAPAIANALFSATGQRLRRLPLVSQEV